MIRTLRLVRRSAIKARTQAANQLTSLLVTAPEPLRAKLRGLSLARLVDTAAAFRVGELGGPGDAAKKALRSLARRYLALHSEVRDLDRDLDRLVSKIAPQLIALAGVGTDVAGALLVAAGDNPERLGTEAAFASLCGVAPVPASSGKTNRHRLSRAGDRIANNALWRVAIVRMKHEERTRLYVKRRTEEGPSKKEIIRCLKRYIAREIYPLLQTVDI
jgi:transposase